MGLPFSAKQAEIVAKAYTTGVETSIGHLAELFDLKGGRLDVAWQVAELADHLKLELVPPPYQDEFDSPRVLRAVDISANIAAEINQLIGAGEGSSVEFKSSMLCSMRDWEKEGKRVEHPSLPGEILKTICAFLNSEGGDLLVGVSDNQTVCPGIRLDLELKTWDLDKWQLHFQALVTSRFHEGAMVQSHLRPRLVAIDGESVFHVRVMPRRRRSFVQREKGKPYEFFVRNGPRTDSLDLPSFYGTMARD